MLSYALAAAVVLATSVVAQGTQGLPSCAASCITNYGGCNQVDVKCICTNKPLLTQLSCCVSQKCTADEIKAVIQFADTLCGSYGVTNLPSAASCSGTASATATASGTASSATSMGTQTGTATSAPASAAASATSYTTGSGSMAAATSAASESIESASASASAAATESGSAAGKSYKAEGVGMVMAVLGFLAAL